MPTIFPVMDRQLSKFGVKNVLTQCKSFLDSDPMDPQYAGTEYILLDPSVRRSIG